MCHVVVLPRLDGSQRAMLEICRGLDRRRFEPHVICQGSGVLTETLDAERIPYQIVPDLQRSVNPWHDVRALAHIRRICASGNFDIVHTHTSKGGLVGRLGARLAGTPVIVHHVQGFAFHEFSGFASRVVYGGLERLAARWADTLVFVNNEERETMIARKWILPADCLTIPNGIDARLYEHDRLANLRPKMRAQFGIADGEVAVLVSGRIDPQKQPLILPQIAAAASAAGPSTKWCIYVAGEGVLEARLRAGIAELGMQHRVKLIGWQSQPESLISAFDIVLLPSLWEGLPLSLLEAQTAGLPIVASNVKGNREVVVDGTGYLCDPRGATSYAAALVPLLGDQLLRRRLGDAARKRAADIYSSATVTQRIAQLYETLLARNGAAAQPA